MSRGAAHGSAAGRCRAGREPLIHSGVESGIESGRATARPGADGGVLS